MFGNTMSSGTYGELQQQQDDYFGSCPKKPKKVKVRRRGPGVAELEKIRLQEEKKSPHSSSSSLPNIDHTLFVPPPRGVSDLVMMPPNFALHHHTMNPSPGGFYQFLELPSNQKSCLDNNVSQFPEEENKMVMSVKRPWHVVTETISRDVKQNQSLDMRLITPAQDSGTTICNPIAIDSPTSIGSFPRNYPRFIPLSLQYEQQQQQKQKDFDENVQRRSKMPFYSFIPSDKQSNGDREQGASDRYESAGDHGIDLSLKL